MIYPYKWEVLETMYDVRYLATRVSAIFYVGKRKYELNIMYDEEVWLDALIILDKYLFKFWRNRGAM